MLKFQLYFYIVNTKKNNADILVSIPSKYMYNNTLILSSELEICLPSFCLSKKVGS